MWTTILYFFNNLYKKLKQFSASSATLDLSIDFTDKNYF